MHILFYICLVLVVPVGVLIVNHDPIQLHKCANGACAPRLFGIPIFDYPNVESNRDCYVKYDAMDNYPVSVNHLYKTVFCDGQTGFHLLKSLESYERCCDTIKQIRELSPSIKEYIKFLYCDPEKVYSFRTFMHQCIW